MDFKQVWLYTGEPYLAFKIDGEFQYPLDEWTDVPPPEGIYQPFYFNGNEWIGSTREEWLTTLPDNQVEAPSESDELNTQLIMNDLEHNLKIEMLEQDIANLTSKLLELQGGN
ncbi:hypothetical protein [Staphylococcus sp. LCT-H4]|uniref:hypothetical protein n=1 Tax=Staphylococcus sp. LCT-H4 TaxID=1914308 RepID=UPI0008F546F0|nr:hypothetical protein [Staphylococcus sp. LCT-H4]OIJ29059.1 hypothetical protein BK821_12465 [Staphylococcus sp. LCT-H4]